MKWTMRYAALLAALLMALALVQLVRPSPAAATNEDVEFLQPPSDKGDPDTGGTYHFAELRWSSWLQRIGRLIGSLRDASSRTVVNSRRAAVSGSSNNVRKILR